jgi:glycosyltransferase involved in cell wall biosynthesis
MVDQFLRDYRGHNFNYVRSVCLEARARGLQFKVLAQRGCASDVRETLPVDAILQAMLIDRPSNRAVRALKNFSRFSSDLARGDTSFLDRRWVLFLDNAHYPQLSAWGRWLRRFPPQAAPASVIMLRFGVFGKRNGRWGRQAATTMRSALRLLEWISRKRRIRLVTDSEILAREFSTLTCLPVTVLPIPHTNPPSSDNLPASSLSPARAINLVVPGRPALYRGIGTLAMAMKHLANQGRASQLTLTVQDYPAPFPDPEARDYQDQMAMLRQLGAPSVQIITEALDTEAYYRMLSEADVVVLPYFRDVYYSQTSGPFTEALSMAKPVIVTADTWMSAQLARFGAGLTFRDRDADDLARAICMLRDNYPQFAEQALARRESWVAYHNPENFVDELIKVANG